MCVHTHTHTHTHTHIYIYMCVCVCVCAHTHTYTYMYIDVYETDEVKGREKTKKEQNRTKGHPISLKYMFV